MRECRRRSGAVERMQQAKTIDPKKSAALFVGVRDFPWDKTLATVPYAVDDAVDLAYELTMEQHSPLVDSKRVVLALSGEPQKAESQEKLRKLLVAGATTHDATQRTFSTCSKRNRDRFRRTESSSSPLRRTA